MSKDKNAYWKTLNWCTKLVLMTGFVDTGKDTLTLEHRIIPFSKHHVLSMKTKRHGMAYGKLMVTWGGFFSQRQNQWKTATSQSSQRRCIKVSVFTRSTRSFVRRKLWENMKWNCRICHYCLSVQAMNSSVFGTRVDFWVNQCRLVEDVTHIYATNVGGGKSRGIAM